MNKQFYIEVCLTVMVLLFSLPVFAQGNEPASTPASESEEAVAEEPEVSASQEVEINEDNYRQFMELKDANRQRDMMPENVFKPETGLQKLDKLPEESQKHLRNELREIIVQGDPWQPGDEDAEYPYVPSAAALTDPSLQNQEREAWGELVDSYNQREAQIYQNSTGSGSAIGSENGSGAKPGDGGQSEGESGEGSQGQQPGEENNSDQDTNAGTYSPNATNDPNAANTAGVSQNAMEFLQGLGKGGNGTGQNTQGTSKQSGGQGESPTPSDAQSRAETGQQGGSDQQSSANSDAAKTARDPNARSTAGASQNAMEFLKGNTGQDGDKGDSGSGSSASAEGQGESRQGEKADSQADGQQNGQGDSQESAQSDARDSGQADGQGDGQTDGEGQAQAEGQDEGQGQDRELTETAEKPASSVSPDNTAPISTLSPEEESTAGASQNALEYLTGKSVQTGDGSTDEPDTGQQEGTLSIQDLLNAQGVGEPTGTAPSSPNPDEEQKPGGNRADKDGGG